MDMPLIQPVAILDEFGNLETCCTCFDQFENTSGVRTSSFLGFRQQGAANTPFENEFPSVRMYLLIQTSKGNEINEMDEKNNEIFHINHVTQYSKDHQQVSPVSPAGCLTSRGW